MGCSCKCSLKPIHCIPLLIWTNANCIITTEYFGILLDVPAGSSHWMKLLWRSLSEVPLVRGLSHIFLWRRTIWWLTGFHCETGFLGEQVTQKNPNKVSKIIFPTEIDFNCVLDYTLFWSVFFKKNQATGGSKCSSSPLEGIKQKNPDRNGLCLV